jgi:hypothetical protein
LVDREDDNLVSAQQAGAEAISIALRFFSVEFGALFRGFHPHSPEGRLGGENCGLKIGYSTALAIHIPKRCKALAAAATVPASFTTHAAAVDFFLDLPAKPLADQSGLRLHIHLLEFRVHFPLLIPISPAPITIEV